MAANFIVDLGTMALFGNSLFSTIITDTTTNGTGIDMQLADGEVHLVYSTGNCGDLVTAMTIKLQESASVSGSYTDISGATVTLAASATANDSLAASISTRLRSLRWVRGVVVTSGGGTVSCPVSLTVLGRKKITGTGNGAQL